MSTEPLGVSHDPDDLQFDRAEFAEPTDFSVTCNACSRPIADEYYEVNGNVLCDQCRQGVSAYFAGGSPVGRVFRASLFGSLTAIACTIAYATFRYFSPVDIAWTAIGIGLLVGKMVRKGSSERGGLFYQFLAVFLTYTSLSVAYFTSFWALGLLGALDPFKDDVEPNPPAVQKGPAVPGKPVAQAQPEAGEVVDGPDIVEAEKQADAEAAPNGKGPIRPAVGNNNVPPDLSLGAAVVMIFVWLAMLTALVYAFPFILIFHYSGILSLFVGLALFQAWVINKRTPIIITGPHRVGPVEHA